MKLSIQSTLDYRFEQPTDLLLQVEAAIIPEQVVTDAFIELSPTEHFARVVGHDQIGDRIWLRVAERLTVHYRAVVTTQRLLADISALRQVPMHLLPGETVEYLMPSRFCQSDQCQHFVDGEFAGLEGGARIDAIRAWVEDKFSYVPGSTTAETTALDTFVKREGVCRDYAHAVVTLARACGVPARYVSAYALGVEPQDFHAVAEVFLDGAWHLVDATGMAQAAGIAKIGVGRDAADVSFLTAYGQSQYLNQQVWVSGE
ncbi:transglutaminase-like domain-containing protein [Sphingomonas japonica]|uniref:Transglutaminase-like putative cysteine protease n=1 Tax=Sphingomonas japonica TaxID=511662 RepID=A0ABX0U301_9SPHN|nr:transglutaminase family protein [Sphingomonas japonica]NIJ24109.1 transglutaminase-like putative cysteine protease [Sphingomonas japonica]